MKRFTVLTTVFALVAFLAVGSLSFAADAEKKADEATPAVTTSAPEKEAPAKKATKKKAAKKAEAAPKAEEAPKPVEAPK